MTGGIDTPTAIAAIVSPIKALGALLGFAIGFVATYRAGGAVSDSILHGILGALLLLPCAWFLALFLVREGIKANVQLQRHRDATAAGARGIAEAAGRAAPGTRVSPALERDDERDRADRSAEPGLPG